jgi:hypothetical protein
MKLANKQHAITKHFIKRHFEKKLKLFYGHSINCSAGCFELTHFEHFLLDTSS